MMRSKLIIIAAFIFLASFHSARASTIPFFYSGEKVFYYVPTTKGFASLSDNIGKIDILAPQSYGLTASGTLYGSVPDSVLALARAHQTKIMPLVVNQSFSESGIESVLDNPPEYQAIAQALVKEAKAQGFAGWQLDIEHIGVAYKDKYSAFVQALGTVIRQNNLTFSVAVVAKTSDDPSNYPAASWNDWVGAYDYKALAPSVDFLSVMAYDDPHSIGPVAGFPFYAQALKYALANLPANKISFGIPVYGWNWKLGADAKSAEDSYSYAQSIFKDKRQISYGIDQTQEVPWVIYMTKGTKTKEKRILWYEDVTSLQEKLQLLTSNNVRGMSAWVLGMEDPRLWNILK